MTIGSHLIYEAKASLTQLLEKNSDVFAWTHQDMPRIDPAVITHRLNVDPVTKSMKQKPRFILAEQSKAIAAEVKKLKQAKFIRDVRFPSWVSNVVMVRKHDGR
jgi:hypothetical protein